MLTQLVKQLVLLHLLYKLLVHKVELFPLELLRE
jgi:hypothetical protein